ncbi:MAG TPA: FAD-dependent thymidylate synthase [Candidatus Nanoarchaeia archaeon]|nr:FAD-dependent thymidylate synthase [Candidatus Nanoarchaeia archaeon]
MAKRKYNALDELPQEVKEGLGKYVTNIGGRTFVIQSLPPETTGGALARYSRSPTGMQLTLANEFLDDRGTASATKGTELMDRVLNAYGDDSVGELEGVHVGIEDISQIGTKFIEDRRIGGSPIEQSTRYVKYDKRDANGKWRYLRPKEVQEAELLPQFEKVNDKAFEIYTKQIPLLEALFKRQLTRAAFKIEVEREGRIVKVSESELNPQNSEEQRSFNNGYNFTIRCAALDVGRCVLPASTLTHLGVFGNGRFFSNLITYMKSNELVEAQERGYELEAELKKAIPTFIKRNRRDPKRGEIDRVMRAEATSLFGGTLPQQQKVTLLSRVEYLDDIVSTSLYPYTNLSLQQIREIVKKLPPERKRQINALYVGNRESRRDRTGRGLEAGYPLTFDLVGGFAEYRDLERHRMLTQQRQNLSPELGFIIPPEVSEIGLDKEVEDLVDQMKEMYDTLKGKGLETAAQYATLFNHQVRFSLGMNLREFQHLSELRTQPAGHFSYRSMVMEMVRETRRQYPFIEDFTRYVDFSDPDNKITRANEQSRIAGKNSKTGTDSSIDLE